MSLKFVWDTDEEVDERCIRYLEDKWNIKFPKEYVEIVQKHNGSGIEFLQDDGRRMDSKIKINKHKESSVYLLAYSKLEEMEYSHILNTQKAFADCLPNSKKIVAFAQCGGNVFFFDYRKNESEPSILFLNHEECIPADDLREEELQEKSIEEWQEETLQFVANSFHELLEKVEPDSYINPVE